ncbi:MAG TPA: GNAT family N-acetyltransferase [Tepidisphaeraceae bacterium]|nr:GNAT family N-acetyltransferase [Tepidisphaeraceae bacterium]
MSAPAHVPTARATSRVQFRIATRGDDAALRQLLRDNPMPGRISLSLQREPDYFAAAAIEGPDHRTIIAEENGRVICAGSISTRLRYINGEKMRVGYLGGLRLDSSCRGRTGIIIRGYQFFREMHEHGGPLIYLTSIVGDNLPARRLLEKGVRGMPSYRFVGELVTLVIPCRHAGGGRHPAPSPPYSGERAAGRGGLATDAIHDANADRANVPSPQPSPQREQGAAPTAAQSRFSASVFVGSAPRTGFSLSNPMVRGADPTPIAQGPFELLNREQDRYQFAPAWCAGDFDQDGQMPGLSRDDFYILNSPTGDPIACAAIWDQRAIKQTVIRGYSPALRRLRPAYNAIATLFRKPLLPAVGEAVSHAFISHLATAADRPGDVRPLVNQLQKAASRRGIDYLTLGLDARDPRVKILRRFLRPREYLSRLYAVHWDDGAELARSLDDRLLAPELALL